MKLPSPPVTTTAPQRELLAAGQAEHRRPSAYESFSARVPSRYCGPNGPAWATRLATRSRPLTAGKPATSRISFSGYMAVTWPPGSGSASITATDSPRNPA